MNANYWAAENEGVRMAVLRALAAGGHEQHGPSGNGILVSVARRNGSTVEGVRDADAVMAKLGLTPVDADTYWYFPLCSDRVAARLRHMGPRQRPGDDPGYRLTRVYRWEGGV